MLTRAVAQVDGLVKLINIYASANGRLLQRGREARDVDADVLLREVELKELEDLVPAVAVDGVRVPHRRVLRPQSELSSALTL